MSDQLVVPSPSPDVLAEMERQGWTPLQREAVIHSTINSQRLSGIIVPLDVAVAAFDLMLFSPLPRIGERDE